MGGLNYTDDDPKTEEKTDDKPDAAPAEDDEAPTVPETPAAPDTVPFPTLPDGTEVRPSDADPPPSDSDT